MDFEEAISAHVGWKIAFRTAVDRKRSVDAPHIARDDCCTLGKWLHGEAKKRYAALPAYAQCLDAHAKFHREAGRVSQLINRGDFVAAEAELASGAPFGEASTMAIVGINKLKRAL